ncbi:MAG: N6-L-threonylcarbamoyladenine synthase [Patiriisocius sp.]
MHEALKEANVELNQINLIAYTKGPGLMGSLLVGTSFAKSLSQALQVPHIGINHMRGHILSLFIKDEEKRDSPEFPFICLTVSGGHTQIVRVNSAMDMIILGQTRDDAAGEAFDKAAKVLGLPYPGGPLIDKYAKEGNPERFTFPHPNIPAYDFSFSGIKTAFLYFIRDEVQFNPNFIVENLNDICASYQRRIVEILIAKLKRAVKDTGVKSVAMVGGVSANSALRMALVEMGEKLRVKTFFPPLAYCTDNAAMIGIAGYMLFNENVNSPIDEITSARLSLEDEYLY